MRYAVSRSRMSTGFGTLISITARARSLPATATLEGADTARDPGRSFSLDLPLAVVPARNRRVPGPRAHQAFIKRGLPRSLLSDNGSAMIADETTQGLLRLSIVQRTTLSNSPYQNGKQEVFFAQVEARLLAMLEGQAELELGLLNQATQAWVEMDYHRRVHSETKQAPLDRFMNAPSVARQSPSLEELRSAFTAACIRTQRKSDSTITIHGTRYQIPARFRRQNKISVRLARWDKSLVLMIDEQTDLVLEALYPLDKARNASALRRPIEQTTAKTQPADTGLAPLLRKQMAEYAATGMPPAYLHMNKETSEKS